MPPKRQRQGTNEASSSRVPTRTQVPTAPQPQGGQRGQNLRPHELNIYNIPFRSDAQRARYDVLIDRRIVPTRFLDMDLMERLGLASDIRYMVDKIGGQIILNRNFNTYAKYVLEILSSLEVHALHQQVAARDVNIRFRVNGRRYSLFGDDINSIYGFHAGGARQLDHPQSFRAWEYITGNHEYKASSAKCSLITNPVVRCFQKAMANSILARGDSQNVCRKQELYFIWAALCSTEQIDLGYHLVKQLKDVSNKTSGPICIGGMLTPLLNYLDVDLSNEEPEAGPMRIDLSVLIQAEIFVQSGSDIYLRVPRIKLPNTARTTIRNHNNWRLAQYDVSHVPIVTTDEDEEEGNEEEEDEVEESESEEEAEGAYSLQSLHQSMQLLHQRQDRQDELMAQMAQQLQSLYSHFFPPPPPPPTA